MELPKSVSPIFKKIQQAGHQVYLVGGVVRDELLKRPHTDWDLTTDATPEQLLKLLPDSYSNNQFGTVGLALDKGLLEITTMRREGRYSDSRHPDQVSWTDKIEEDLARRDFTINAMAMDPTASESASPTTTADLTTSLIDPFHGQADLQAKIIRAVGDPNQRFQEDALRLMRAIRFAAQLGFTIEPQTWQAIQSNKELIKNISWERIRDELLKILAAKHALSGMQLLKDSGLLAIILPEVQACFGIQQQGPKHDRVYDVGEHLLQVMHHTPSTDPIVKLAALLHDIGKPATAKVTHGNTTFYHHEIVGTNLTRAISRRLKLSRKDTDRLIKLVRYHMFTVNENQTDAALRRFVRNVGLANLDDMMALREGDRLGGGTATPTSWRLESFKKRIQKLLIKPFSITDLKVNGQDVMETLNIPPGRKVGEILKKLFAEVEADASKNTREYLLQRVKQLQ